MTLKKCLIILLIVILLIVAAAVAEKRTPLLRHAIDAWLYGPYFHYLPCEALPSDAEVRQALRDPEDVAQAIRGVNPGQVGMMMGRPAGTKPT